MRKHSGKVMVVGIGASVFGLLLMAGKNFSNGVFGKSASEAIVDLLKAVDEASWLLLILGITVLVVGVYMFTQAD
jgi:Na+-driven multidrug efflux pump